MTRGVLAGVVLVVVWPLVRLFSWWDDHAGR